MHCTPSIITAHSLNAIVSTMSRNSKIPKVAEALVPSFKHPNLQSSAITPCSLVGQLIYNRQLSFTTAISAPLKAGSR